MSLNSLETLLEIVARLAEIEASPDSIEIGAPSKGGAVKVYGNCQEIEAFKRKIENAERLRLFAQDLRERGDGGQLAHGLKTSEEEKMEAEAADKQWAEQPEKEGGE